MKFIGKILGVLLISASFAYCATTASISGTVKDPTGAPVRGAFVRAQNMKSKIIVNVLSDSQGHYRIADLAPGEYEVRVSALGFKGDPREGVKLAAGASSPVDFALQQSPVRWNELSLYQAKALLPDGEGKKILTANCFACHGFQTRMATPQMSLEAWKTAVTYMRTTRHARLADHINDQQADVLISYLNDAFGANAKLPRSPADLPGYKNTVRTFSDAALKIVYVEYEMPGPNRMPFSAAPDKDGKLWIPDMGIGNTIGHLDPNTGEIQEFASPMHGAASIHSAIPAADGSVWLTEQAPNRLGRWDPKTHLISEFQDTYKPGSEGLEDGGSKHTVRVDPNGRVWATSATTLSVYDPKTNEFSHYPDTKSPYGVEIDQSGNIWFAEFSLDGEIGMVDSKTFKLTKWAPPTPHSRPRRIQIDTDGTVWFAEFAGGKITSFDPKTHTFKEYPLPGPNPSPYALGIDKNHNLWYSSDDMDIIGRLDPKTGNVTEYPFSHSENDLKEFFLDADGRMWYGSAPNNVVGYFIPPTVN